MDELANRLKQWPTSYKVTLLAAPLVIALAVFLLMNIKPAPRYATLYSGLDLRDSAAIVKELKKQNVAYLLQNEGKDIQVPLETVYETRVSLAEKQLPFSTQGFELFDKTKLGVTETGQRVDYQRAMEGELVRTLEEMPAVEQARVHLVIPPESSFLFEEKKGTASVMVVTQPGYNITEPQVQGIIHLVSHAVPNLSDKDVVVTDQNGAYLSGGLEGSTGFGLDNPQKQLEIKKSYETHLERKVLDLLEPLYGKGNISCSVSVEMDFNKVSRESEKVSPVVGDSGIPVKEKETRKSSSDSSTSTSGIPGTTSNIPGYLGPADAVSGEGGANDQSDRETEYNVNRELESMDIAPGSILRKSATVILSTDQWDDKKRAEMEGWVQNAISADPTRGDTIAVSAYVFTGATADELKGEVASSARRQMTSSVMNWVGVFIILLVFFFVARSVVGSTMGKREGALSMEDLEKTVTARAGPVSEEDEEFYLPSIEKGKQTRFTKMREEIVKLINDKPEDVANLVRAWLVED
jgi:flagellar M-ring protein FliF